MKIAIDLRPLQIGHQNRGIGAYLLNLLQHLPENDNLTFVILRYDVSDPVADYGLHLGNYSEVIQKKHSFSKHPAQLLQYVITSLMPDYSELRRHKPDVFFQCDYLLGAPKIASCKLVTVAHDLIPLRLRQYYLPSWRKYIGLRQLKLKSRVRRALRAVFYEVKYQHAFKLLRRSDAIISVSENTKQDLVELLHISPAKIHTIYSAASFRDNESEAVISEEVKKKIDDFDYPYLVYIGGTDVRRQVDELVYAFNVYNARNGKLGLVLCGNEFEKDSKDINARAKYAIEHSSYAANIQALGRITEAEKKYVLSHAAAFVYPTLYEGFGLPMIEAMAAGTPVIAYKNSSLIELGKDNVWFTKEPDGQAIYQSLLELFGEESSVRARTSKAQQHALTFSWDKTAAAIWKLVLR